MTSIYPEAHTRSQTTLPIQSTTGRSLHPSVTESHWNATDLARVDPENLFGKLGSVVIVAIIAVGLVGNTQVLVALAKCRLLRRSYNAFIASLSATDLVFNVLALPFFADSYVHRSWRYPTALCRFLTHFGAMLVMASGLHIGLIAVNRYALIIHPSRFRCVSSPAAIAVQVGGVWTVAFVTVLPAILGLNAVVGYSDQLGRCNYLRTESRSALSAIFCVGFLSPCAVMTYCYVVIWKTAIRSQGRVGRHQGQTPSKTMATGGRSSVRCDLNADHELGGVPGDSANDYLAANVTSDNVVEPPLAKRDTVKASLTCFEFWCSQGERSVTGSSYTDCDESATSQAKTEDLADVGRCQGHRTATFASSRRTGRGRGRGRGRLGSLRMILVVFLAFVLTYLPFTLMNLLDEGSRLHRGWYMTASLVFWAGSCVNPVIYGIMNGQFRKAYCSLFSVFTNRPQRKGL